MSLPSFFQSAPQASKSTDPQKPVLSTWSVFALLLVLDLVVRLLWQGRSLGGWLSGWAPMLSLAFAAALSLSLRSWLFQAQIPDARTQMPIAVGLGQVAAAFAAFLCIMGLWQWDKLQSPDLLARIPARPLPTASPEVIQAYLNVLRTVRPSLEGWMSAHCISALVMLNIAVVCFLSAWRQGCLRVLRVQRSNSNTPSNSSGGNSPPPTAA